MADLEREKPALTPKESSEKGKGNRETKIADLAVEVAGTVEGRADQERDALRRDVEGEKNRSISDMLADLYDRVRGKKTEGETDLGVSAASQVENPDGEEKPWYSKAWAFLAGGATSLFEDAKDVFGKIFGFNKSKAKKAGVFIAAKAEEIKTEIMPRGDLEHFADTELLNPEAPAFTFQKGKTPRISSHFGFRNDPIDRGKSQDHRGVDIGGLAVGTKIVSTLDGCKVLASFFDKKAGNLTKILMPDGKVAAYMHLKNPGLKKGTIINKGDVFAEVGMTGSRVTGPHIHFEIRPGEVAGNWIDPASHLPAELVAQEVAKRDTYYQKYPHLKAKAQAKADQEALASATV